VLSLDDSYQHALVAGPDRDYLWILSRDPTLDAPTYAALISQARELEFPVDELVQVSQDPETCQRTGDIGAASG
jgi:lipocalin